MTDMESDMNIEDLSGMEKREREEAALLKAQGDVGNVGPVSWLAGPVGSANHMS